jgi:hypothetical protein
MKLTIKTLFSEIPQYKERSKLYVNESELHVKTI